MKKRNPVRYDCSVCGKKCNKPREKVCSDECRKIHNQILKRKYYTEVTAPKKGYIPWKEKEAVTQREIPQLPVGAGNKKYESYAGLSDLELLNLCRKNANLPPLDKMPRSFLHVTKTKKPKEATKDF